MEPLVAPWDEHNRRLVSHVHPPGWANPTPRARYHLVVIGGGTGGLVTAAIAAALGARVALVERHLMGGDCLNVGCVPSKALLRAARAWHEAQTAGPRFGGPGAGGTGDFAAAMERMRRIRADLSLVDSAARFRDLGVDVYFGEAHFAAPDAVEVAGARLRFRRAVIATGGRPALPPIPGLADAAPLTTDTVFSLTALPARLAVLGGGPVGCELAQAFARFGARVTLLESAERILPNEDPDAAEVVAGALARDGVRILAGAEVSGAVRTGEVRRVAYRREGVAGEVECDAVLVAAGRTANVEPLALDAAGIRAGAHGVEVDDRLRTANRRVYAIGDAASRLGFTHLADAHARLVVRNALFAGRGRASRLVVPWCTYTSPELAHVGITAAEAATLGTEVDTVTVPFAEVDRARLDGAAEGFLRVRLRRGSDRILGATIVGEHAGELIMQITTAMTARIGLGALGRAIYPYPTLSEAIRRAADAHQRRRLTPAAKRLFDVFFRVVR